MSSTKYKIKVSCSACGGTGQQPIQPEGAIACFMCNGTGEQETGFFKLKEIEDKLDQILEKLNE